MRAHTGDCMTVRGIVRATAAHGVAEVELFEAPGCKGCAGACLWRRLDGASRGTIHVHAPNARAGSPVLVALPHRYLLLGTLLLHGLPWAALLAGAAAGSFVTGGDLGTLAGAAAAVLVAVLATPRLRRRVERAAVRGLALHPLP